jgi:hypothetical protein
MEQSMILLIIVMSICMLICFGLYKAKGLKSIIIEKKITICASKQQVFDMVKYLKKFPKWSPFLVKDPSQQFKIVGTDGTVGAQYYWEGKNGNDIGYQEIIKIEELKFIKKKCDVQEPFLAKPTFEYYFNESVNGIEVREVYKLESCLIDAFFLWLFGAKAEMEKTNQQGLDLLNKAVTAKN